MSDADSHDPTGRIARARLEFFENQAVFAETMLRLHGGKPHPNDDWQTISDALAFFGSVELPEGVADAIGALRRATAEAIELHVRVCEDPNAEAPDLITYRDAETFMAALHALATLEGPKVAEGARDDILLASPAAWAKYAAYVRFLKKGTGYPPDD